MFKKCVALLALIYALLTAALPAAALPDMVHGVDLSSYQGEVNWAAVKADGMDFVILRAGTSYGKDTKFEENYTAAKAAGLGVGCYFYTYAKTPETVQKETAEMLEWLRGKQLEYPVYFDIEDPSLEPLTNDQRTTLCLTFLKQVKEAGFCGGVYASRYWFTELLDLPKLQKAGEIWWAQWIASGKPDQDFSDYGMWQYASDGRVNGVWGDVDMNVAYKDYPALMRQHGWNGYPLEPTPGDVDGDCTVTSTDARLVLQYAVGKVTEEDLNVALADVDSDGEITSTDARLILQKAVGKIDTFPTAPPEDNETPDSEESGV